MGGLLRRFDAKLGATFGERRPRKRPRSRGLLFQIAAVPGVAFDKLSSLTATKQSRKENYELNTLSIS